MDELVSCYNATLIKLIDKHAPEQRKRITVRRKQPWYSNNLAKLNRQRRKLEGNGLNQGQNSITKSINNLEIRLLTQLKQIDVNICQI